MSTVDESKVKALESIFGGQDITASVIRTVLTSNDNKFDDAVDSLLNMTTGTNNSRSPSGPSPSPHWAEEPIDNDERAKIKTLENMFGTDLSNSVICTVLESNRGELVDAVDTLLNMTSKEINPQFQEKSRVEADIKSYEEFKRLQIKLQEEEARAAKEQQQKIENEMLKKNNKQDISEADKCKQIMEEQEKVLREYEAKVRNEQNQKMAELKKNMEMKKELEDKARREAQENERMRLEKQLQQEQARLKTERESERIKREIERAKREEGERMKREQIERAKQLEVRRREEIERAKKEEAEEMAAAIKKEMEEKLRFEAEKQQLLLEQLRKEEQKLKEAEALRSQEVEKLKAKSLAEEKRRKEEEERRLAEVVDEIRRTEQKRVDKLIRHQREEVERKTMVEMEAQRRRIEEEERERRRRLEEEEAIERHRRMLEEERIALQKARAELQAKLKAQEDAEIQKAEEIRRVKIAAEEARILREKELAEREEQDRKDREEREERERFEEEERKRLQEEERIRIEREEQQERLRLEEEDRLRAEQEALEQKLREEEAARDRDAEALNKKEEKLSYDLLAASAIFIPPKELTEETQVSITVNVIGDTVVCTWDMPAGNAAPTNWLGIYSISQPANNKYTQFAYTNSTSAGQHVFKSVTPGHYEVRFFANKGYEAPLARSVTIRIGPTATIMAQLQGEHLLVYYTLDPISATPTREWLGIYEKTQRRNKLYLGTAYGNAEGQVMMKAPRTPGEYQVRLFATGSVYNYQAKADFVVEDNDCINIEPTSLLAGANVNISWILRTLEPSTSDWVGLYRADEQNNSNYLSCTYTQGSSVGVATVQVPKEAGVYEFRLFAKAKGKYTTFRKSEPLTIV